MNETLIADKGKVVKAYENAGTKRKGLLEEIFGVKTFLPNVIERIKNFDDVLRETNTDKKAFEKLLKGLEPDEVAYKKAKLVCQAYNEDWVPDWDNSNQYKYYPYFDMRSSASGGFAYGVYDYWSTDSCVGSHLCFENKAKAEAAGRLFEQEIYKPLITL